VQAAGDLPQLVQHTAQVGGRLVQLCRESVGSGGHCRAHRAPQVQGEGDQALLGAVVQVAFDAPTGGVSGGHDAGAGRGERGPDLGVGDRGRDQFRETGQPCRGARGQRFLAGRGDHDPPTAGPRR